MTKTKNYDAIVVGAGFAGLYSLYKLRNLGLSVKVLEAGSGVGGTWYWNRYPGARCDVDSMEYSFQFSQSLQQEWCWSQRYAPQAEILAYAQYVAERFDLATDIQFDTRVESAHFSEEEQVWFVRSEQGELLRARFCIMATGCLSSLNKPDLPGLDDFSGEVYFTGCWPQQEPDFRGKTVGIIGTGSSAIQAIPLLAQQAKRLLVFQRTASYSIPARNQPLDPEYEAQIKADYPAFRARNSQLFAAIDNRPNHVSALDVDDSVRDAEYEQRWQDGGLPFLASFNDISVNLESNHTAAEFLRRKIRSIVNDPRIAELLCPTTVVGCKRLCVDTDYYQTFNRDNVELVDVAGSPINKVDSGGIVTSGDVPKHYALDSLILATGFDAMTGALLEMDIRGREGLSLQKKWAHGPRSYLGLTVAGFPNLFTITGPGSPSVLANMIVAIEQHVNWIGDCIKHLENTKMHSIEASRIAETKWLEHVNDIAAGTLFPTGCNSWYMGANVPGKPRAFMPYLGFPAYVKKCQQIVADNYAGFDIRPINDKLYQ